MTSKCYLVRIREVKPAQGQNGSISLFLKKKKDTMCIMMPLI